MKRALFILSICALVLCAFLSLSVFAAPQCNMTLAQNYSNAGSVQVFINDAPAQVGLDGKYFIPADATVKLIATANTNFAFD